MKAEKKVGSSNWRTWKTVLLALFACCGIRAEPSQSSAGTMLHMPMLQGAVHGFPEMRDKDGRKVADAEFMQIPDRNLLRVILTYDLGSGEKIEEDAVVRQRPVLVQESWSWTETRNREVVRRFTVDFSNGSAVAETLEGGERKSWHKHLKIEPGRTFAGFAFTLALECLRAEPNHGTGAKLRAIVFMPYPRIVTVEVGYVGAPVVTMAGRRIEADEFSITPDLPAIARMFVAVPDTRIWLIHSDPTGFLRWRGPLVEPDDPIMTVNLLPSSKTGD